MTGAGVTVAAGSVAGVTVVAGSVAGVTAAGSVAGVTVVVGVVAAGSVTGVLVVTVAVVLGSTDVADVAALTAATAPITRLRDNVLTIRVFFMFFIKIILPQSNYNNP
ncbi:hypothetical protein [Desulfosporosinus sp. BICA1-9]|uniref:hypothetical protein n=1 Tax=Desulfosporosinus sp. BICA1-9 TaxID=1531958 RepID=UPI00054C59FA|nr:hypothetical protein [Desulfosporosinus sp. BICA1-9]KJS47903.1 MAG: hypothetical protein VR66_17000 [Peptococcaceae bacterium BRH_c23]KJS49153.1 MAG: hypothetical protein VR66_10200 [Peptococcaceae bacterium BRH_c23]KJS88693.1 MAG: hypothetical protein JL57_11055 [Desulfosporosinus sp. BICA1-9]HBW36500.1 hypothetical protein [Desulfosporosinus sp.]